MGRACLIFVGVAALASCSPEPQQKPDETRPVRVLRIAAAAGGHSFEAAGEIRARHETRLAFRVGGKMLERRVEVGSRVRAGQLIARLDATDLALAEASARAQEASLEAERVLAAADLARYRELREKNFISRAEFERRASALATAEARLEAARAQRSQAANQSAYAALTADTDGVIVALEAEAGQVLAAGQTVARLARPGELEVAFAVPESQREWLGRATAMTVSVTALPGRTWKARLREVAPAADPATRTYAVRATLLEPAKEIELGMSARAGVSVSGPARIEVPVAALHSRGEQPQVLKVMGDGTVQLQAVKTQGVASERVVIAEGLKPGDLIVAAGAQLLRPGQRVRVLEDE